MKKFIIATLITTAVLSTVSNAAENTLDPSTGGGPLTERDFDNKYDRSVDWITNQTYPPATKKTDPITPSITNTPYLEQLELTNNPNEKDKNNKTDQTYQEKIKQTTISTVRDNIGNTLTYFPYNAYGNHNDTQKNIKEIKSNGADTSSSTQTATAPFASDITDKDAFQNYANNYSLNTLINGSDYSNHATLYIDPSWLTKNRIEFTSDNQLNSVKKPTTFHDDYLNFSTLFSPIAYDTQEAESARKYILFSAQTTKNLAADLKLNTLFPKSLSEAQQKNFITAFTRLKNDPGYQKYMMMINNLIAIRSISLDNLEHLISERTPIKGLGKAAGKKTDSASPLEVEAYQANHRIENPDWYKTIRNDSPATVQRTIAIELAEIEHQNYQAHLDREQILSALIAANLNSNNAAGEQLKLAAMAANSSIKCATDIMNGQQCAATSE